MRWRRPDLVRNAPFGQQLPWIVQRSARGDGELALTGNAIVPIIQRDIADVGYYSFITTSDEAGRPSTDEAGRDELLVRLMSERVEAWLALATERLADSDVPLYLIPGNDDDFVIDEILNRPGWGPSNVDGRVVDMPDGLQLLSCGWSNHTPWQRATCCAGRSARRRCVG